MSRVTFILSLAFLAIAMVNAEQSSNAASASTAWDVYGKVGPILKDQEHERISRLAARKAAQRINTELDVSINENSIFREDGLVNGVRFNDMPLTNNKMQVDYANVGSFATDFGLKLEGDVVESHYGARQYWHSMSPSNAASMTNQDVLDKIRHQANTWWDWAVDLYKRPNQIHPSQLHTKIGVDRVLTNGEYRASFHLGNILHMVQDSYAPSHSIRDGSERLGMGCGRIYFLPDYEAQHGTDYHGESDHKPHSSWFEKYQNSRFAELNKCAVEASTQILKAFGLCAMNEGSCDFETAVGHIFDHIYDMPRKLREQEASGVPLVMAGTEILHGETNFVKTNVCYNIGVSKALSKSFQDYDGADDIIDGFCYAAEDEDFCIGVALVPKHNVDAYSHTCPASWRSPLVYVAKAYREPEKGILSEMVDGISDGWESFKNWAFSDEAEEVREKLEEEEEESPSDHIAEMKSIASDNDFVEPVSSRLIHTSTTDQNKIHDDHKEIVETGSAVGAGLSEAEQTGLHGGLGKKFYNMLRSVGRR